MTALRHRLWHVPLNSDVQVRTRICLLNLEVKILLHSIISINIKPGYLIVLLHMADDVVSENVAKIFEVHEEHTLLIDLNRVYLVGSLHLVSVFLRPSLVSWVPLTVEA